MDDRAKSIIVVDRHRPDRRLVASLIVGGGGGLIGWIIAGLIGSVVGGFLAQQLNIKLNLGNPFLEQVVISIVGAIIVLIIARIIS